MTPLGQIPFFIDFLKTTGLFDALVADCPLRYLSPNAPRKRDILGTAMLSMLAGHKRYAHIAALRCDAVLPELLGIEDCQRGRDQAGLQGDRRDGRRGLAARSSGVLRGAAAGRALDPRRRYDDQAALRPSGRSGPGLQSQEARASEPLLSHLFDGLDASCSRRRRLRRRRAYVQHGAPSLWALIDRLPRDLWPALLRGDCGFGNEGVMREAEARRLPYLFKLRLTKNVRRMIEKLSGREWVNAGQGFWAKESAVRLEGWSRQRRTIVLRRRLRQARWGFRTTTRARPAASFGEVGEATEVYEYSVLVTSLDETTEAFGQLYRDRGDGENIFDEMKNQWGWGGLRDARSRPLSARGAARRAVLRLVEHLRPSRRSQPSPRGDHQPAAVPLGDRDAHAPRAANDHPRPANRKLAAVAAFLRRVASGTVEA